MKEMNNKEYRAKLRKDPHSMLNYISKDIDIVVKTNTKETIYMALSKTNGNMPNLSEVNAAGTTVAVSTLTTAGTAGTISTAAGTVGTLFSFGSVGTTSTVDVDIKKILS